MSGWQIALFILGLCLLAVLIGLLAGYLILRVQRRPWPFSWRLSPNHHDSSAEQITIPTPEPEISLVDKKVKTTSEMQEALEEYVKKRQVNQVQHEISVEPQKSDLLVELETNLSIATTPWEGKLIAFQTRAMDSNRAKIESLDPELKDELIEAYTDIHLANTLVWLSMDVGHRSKDLDESYLKLCNKIAERLGRILPEISRAGV